jgi:acyl-CoA thioesterase FadM
VFEHLLTVRARDLDASGRASPLATFAWCHDVLEAAFVAAGDRLVDAFDEEGWGMPLVHVSLDLVAPLPGQGERLAIGLGVARVGRRSVTLRYALTDGASGQPLGQVELVHAIARLAGLGRVAAVPARLLAVLTAAGALTHPLAARDEA